MYSNNNDVSYIDNNDSDIYIMYNDCMILACCRGCSRGGWSGEGYFGCIDCKDNTDCATGPFVWRYAVFPNPTR